MLITNGTIVSSGMRRRTVQRQVQFGPISLRVVTILVIGAAVLIALMQSTSAATKTYQVTKLQEILSQKQDDLELTAVDVARLQALNNNSVMAGVSPSPTATPPQLVAPSHVNALSGTTATP